MPDPKYRRDQLTQLSHSLDQIAEEVRARLSEKHTAREEAIRLSRDVIRLSANAIRAVHRAEYPEAERLLETASGLLDTVKQGLQAHLDIYHAGFVTDAQKEYAEARTTLAFISGRPLPHPDDLRVEVSAYLNGLGEALGELRRYILDSLRKEEIVRCEELMRTMDEVYSVLVTMDFPDAMTGGLRRTTDAVRGILERTRADLTLAIRQRRLEERLETVRRSIDRLQE